MTKMLSEKEVQQVFNLYRRGNDLPGGDFPTPKNGFKPFLREGNPGNLVDSGALEYMRSQHIDRLYDLPVEQKKIDKFEEQVRQLREEFYNRSVLPKSLQNGAYGHFEKVIVQGEIADVFYKELQKNGFNGDSAKEATRSFYERAWPALERGYSIKDLRNGERSGSDDVNGPEGKVFELRRKQKNSGQTSNDPKKRLKSTREERSTSGAFVERADNPFSLKKPKLEQQSELLERNPVTAKRMILAAGRDPELFGLS